MFPLCPHVASAPPAQSYGERSSGRREEPAYCPHLQGEDTPVTAELVPRPQHNTPGKRFRLVWFVWPGENDAAPMQVAPNDRTETRQVAGTNPLTRKLHHGART